MGALQTSVLGLLGLLLGFTFFKAVSRFETRRTRMLRASSASSGRWRSTLSRGIRTRLPAGYLMTSLNELIDIQEKRQVALDTHI